MELANKIMNARKGAVKKIFNSWTDYPYVLFLDASNHAPEQLKYIINATRRDEIKDVIYNNFGGDKEAMYVADTNDHETEIMDCTNCNLVAINLYKRESESYDEKTKKIIVVSIDYQFPYMKKYFRKRRDVEQYQIISEDIYGTEDT